MADFRINKGFDIKVLGKPEPMIDAYDPPGVFTVYPSEFGGIKPRLKVKAGDRVRRGDILFENKKDERMLFRSPACGEVKAVNLGARRAPIEILIEATTPEESVTFESFTAEGILQLSREQITAHLLDTGLWPLIRQRPFSRIADPDRAPKAVFINAMSSAPFQADFAVVVQGDEAAMQAGIDALSRLTQGPVHFCRAADAQLPAFKRVEKHTFRGPHPAGNTSVHINRISPMLPHDTVYTVSAQDVILIGKLLLTGELPRTRVIALGGPEVKETFRRHYRVPIGAGLRPLFEKAIDTRKETRIIAGSLLWGDRVQMDSAVRYYGSEYCVLAEDRSRHLFGWTTPGLLQYSAHRVNLSSLPVFRRSWKLGTNLHGSRRAMVVTGWMDRCQPLNIMTDFLLRACLAHDTEEMIQLGILETDPEDFALAAFMDPHKTDVCGIIRRGLEEIEAEGI